MSKRMTTGNRKWDEIHYFPRGFYGAVRKIFKVWPVSVWRLQYNFSAYVHTVLVLVAARDLKSRIPKPCSQVLVLVQSVFRVAVSPFWRHTDIRRIVLSDITTKPHKKTAAQGVESQSPSRLQAIQPGRSPARLEAYTPKQTGWLAKSYPCR